MNSETVARQEDTPLSAQKAALVGEEAIRSPMPELKGRVNRHTSGYWALTIPALSVRYLAEAVANIFGANQQSIAQKLHMPKLASVPAKAIEKTYALVVGTFMMVVSTVYMARTYNDIKGAFAESIAWENGKKPEDVNFRDILKSDNTLVEAARRNFFKYNARRFAVNMPFFAHIPFKSVDPRNSVLAGVATNSLYLMSDVLGRKETFFERLQSFVDEKILHTEKIGDKINAIDLINLYELHSRDKNPNYHFTGRMDTSEWQDRVKIFGRMAELMNQTYGNDAKKEEANFTLSKMVYLMGHGMIGSGNPERSCAFIEVANKFGIDALKDVAAHKMSDGSDVAYAKQKYLSQDVAPDCAPGTVPGFAEKYAANDPSMSKGDKILAQQQRAATAGAQMTA